MKERIVGERIICTGRRISKPRLIHYTHRHRALQVTVEGSPATAEVVKAWRIKNKE